MKTINEMTEKQILALTDEDLAKLINLKMAQEGIKLLQRPEEPKLSEVTKPDLLKYNIKGIDFYFKTRELAEEVKNIFKGNMNVAGVGSYYHEGDYKFYEMTQLSEYSHEQLEKFEIKEVEVYSIALYASVKELLKSNEKLQKAYNDNLKEYESEYEKSAYIREEIYGRYGEVCNKYAKFECMKRKYAEYLELANGNHKIAMTFLKKAFTIDKETEDFITPK